MTFPPSSSTSMYGGHSNPSNNPSISSNRPFKAPPSLDHDDNNLKSDMYHSHLIHTNTWISQNLNPNLLNYYYYAMQQHINHFIKSSPRQHELNSRFSFSVKEEYSVCQQQNDRPPPSTTSSVRSLNNSLSVTYPEIMFITNAGGDVVSVDGNGDAWDAYLDAGLIHPMFNTLSPMAAYPLILGRNFIELIMCPKFQSILTYMLQVTASSANKSKLNYHWVSDSVDVERKMRLTLTRLTGIPQTGRDLVAPHLQNGSVLFCWTSKIISETPRAARNLYTHLAYPISPSIMPNSRGMCMLCKRLQVSKSDMSPTQWLDVIQAACVSVSTKFPCLEPDLITPILGMRGKLGVQMCYESSAAPYLWLNGEQIVHIIRTRIDSSPCSSSSSSVPTSSSSASFRTSCSESSSTPPSRIPNDHNLSPDDRMFLNPSQQFDLGSHLALPVHSSLCEVCRLDLLQFFSPLYKRSGVECKHLPFHDSACSTSTCQPNFC